MNKKRTGVLFTLVLLVLAVVLSGCTDPYANIFVEFESATTQEIVLGETPNNTITITSAIKNFKTGMSELMFFSPDRSVVKIESTQTLGGGRTRVTLVGLNPGTATIKAQTLEGSKSAFLTVRVLQPIVDFSLKPNTRPYLVRGEDTMIYPQNYVSFYPENTTEKNVLVNIKDYDVLLEQGVSFAAGVLSLPETFEGKTITAVISAYRMVGGIPEIREDIESKELTFAVISPINNQNIQLFALDAGNNGFSTESIVLLSNHLDFAQRNFYIEVASTDFEESPTEEDVLLSVQATSTFLVSNVSILQLEGSRRIYFTLQTSAKTGSGTVQVQLNYLNNDFSATKTFPATIEVVSERIEVNEQVSYGSNFVSTYTQFSSMAGTPLHLMVYPTDSATKYSVMRVLYSDLPDDILFFTMMGNPIIQPYDLSGQEVLVGRRIDSGVVLFPNHIEIASGTTIYARGVVETEVVHKLKVSIPLYALYMANGTNDFIEPIEFEIPIKVVKGATQLFINQEVICLLGENGEVNGYEREFQFETDPADAYTSDFIVYTNSNIAAFVKLQNNTFKLIPFSTGSGNFTIFLGNGTQKTFVFEIVANLKLTSVSLDVENNDAIGFLNGEEFAIKFTMKSQLSVSFEPFNANIQHIQFTTSDNNVISVGTVSGLISGTNIGGQTNRITLSATITYRSTSIDEFGNLTIVTNSHTVTIKGQCYVPIKAFSMSQSRVQIYDYNTVGFFNKELSQTLLMPVFSPVNATYTNFTATDQSAQNFSLSKFLVSFSNPNYHLSYNELPDYTNLSLQNLFTRERAGEKPTIYTEYMKYSYDTFLLEAVIRPGYLPSATTIVFTVKEFDNEFSFTVEFAPLLQTKVEVISLKNCSPENEIYFDANRRYFQIIADAEPLQAYNRKLKYTFYPPIGGGATAQVSVDNNGFITLLNSDVAGRGFIRITAEDSYSTSTEANRFVDIPIRVADGSYENPYSLRTAQDLINIKGDGLNKFYTLDANINLGNESWVPLGIFRGGITGNGLYTISGIRIDNTSVATAVTMHSTNDSIRNDMLNNLQNTARIRVGLFTKIESTSYLNGEYLNGFIRNVNFSGVIDINRSDSTLLLDVGLVAAQNEGEIASCSVTLNSASVSLTTDIIENQTNLLSRVGAIVGLNVGQIKNYYKINGFDSAPSNNIGASITGGNQFKIVGIYIAFGMMVGQQGEGAYGAIPARNGIIAWERQGTLYENQAQTAKVNAAVSASLTHAFGGLVGINLLNSSVVGVSVSGTLMGYSNVGGIVGINLGYIASSTTTVSVNAAVGGYNIGGIAGLHAGNIENSSVQHFDNDSDNGTMVRGYNAVGGIAGLMTGGFISETYAVSYHNASSQNNIYLAGTTAGSAGGLVGILQAGQLSKVFSHVTVNGGGVVADNLGSLIGLINNTSVIQIQDFYTKSNFGTQQTTTLQPVGAQQGNWTGSDINYGYSYYDLTAGVIQTSYLGTSIYGDAVLFGVANAIADFALLNTNSNWAYAAQSDRPLIRFNQTSINIDPPTGIAASIAKNQMAPSNSGPELVIWVNYYQAIDASKQSYLAAHNSFMLSEYFVSAYQGNNPSNASYNLVNYNPDLIAINENGAVNLLKTGLAHIKITSKFNQQHYVDIYVYITQAAEILDVYVGADFSGKLGRNVTLLLKNNETRKLYAQTSAANINVFEGNTLHSIALVTNSLPAITAVEELVVGQEPSLGFAFASGFFTVTGLNPVVNQKFNLFAYHNLRLNSYEYSAIITGANKLFNHTVTIGAQSIATSTASITTVPYFKNIVDVLVNTDDIDDAVQIIVSQKQGNNTLQELSTAQFVNMFKQFETSFIIANNKMYLKTNPILNSGVFANQIAGYLHLELNESQKYIEQDTTFVITFVAKNGTQYSVTVLVKPQPLLDINISQYNKLSESSPYNERSNIITPGVTAAFTLSISPTYASFDYLDIVSANPSNILIAITIIGSSTVQNAIIIPNGVRLQRSFVKYLIDTYGHIKVGVLCASSVSDGSLVGVNIIAYKAGDVAITKQVNYTARNSVRIAELSIQGMQEGANNILVQGLEYPISFVATGNPDTVEFVTNSSYEIFKRDGNYFIVPSISSVTSAIADVRVVISKLVDGIYYSSEQSIQISIVKAAVITAPIANFDYGKQVIRTPKGNAITMDAMFDNGNSVLYNENIFNIESDLSDLTTQARDHAKWEYAQVGTENWQPLGIIDIYTDSFRAVGDTITILKDSIPYKFKMIIRVAYDLTDMAKMPVIVASSATLPAHLTYVDKVQTFTFEVFENTSTHKAIPVRTQQDLMSMEAGKHYILLDNIYLNSETFVPITANIASFNGNNYRIYLPSSIVVQPKDYIDFALFAEVAQGTLIENVTVAIASNVAVQVAGDGTFTTFNFAGIAVRNYGIITNCEVVSLHNINNNLLQLNEPYRIYIEVPSAGKTVITAGLVANNGASGAITNSRVSVSILGPQNVAGFVHENSGKISSSFVKGVSMSNYDAISAMLSGFVNKNTYSGEIFSSFVEGEFVAQFVNGTYSYTTMHSTLQKIESIDGNAASFVSENSGKITDSFANIRTYAKNYASGFVYENKQSATIKNAFSLSEMQANNNAATAFVGRNEVNRILNDGIISNSAYYMDDTSGQPIINNMIYPNAGIPGLQPLKKSEFTNRNHVFFSTFSVSTDSQKTKGVWFIPSGQFEVDFRLTNTSNMIFFAGRPQLVSPNIIARSQYILQSYELNSQGVYEYDYLLNSSNAIGSVYNPYIIYNASSFENYILSSTDQYNRVTLNYRFVTDIDFANKNILTSHIVFNGDIEGNGMKLNGILLESEQSQATAGLFASIGDKTSGRGSVKNLSLVVNKFYLPNTQSVGALAGTFYGGNIANISVVAQTGSSSVVAKNTAGGVFGLAQIMRESRMFNLSSNLSSVALHQRAASAYNIAHTYNANEQLASFSYAGGIFGVIASSSLSVTTISDLNVYGAPYIMADNAGMVAGYAGKNIVLNKLRLEGSQNMFVRASRTAGGMVGELVEGLINDAEMSGLSTANTFFNTTTVWPLYAGGVAGVVRGGTIQNSTNTIAINFPSTPKVTPSKQKTIAGGIAGLVNVQIATSRNSAGVLQYNFIKGALIDNVHNNAIVRAEEVTGGIVGSTVDIVPNTQTVNGKTTGYPSSLYKVVIINSRNTARIESAANNQASAIVGGIVGTTGNETQITKCFNSGQIIAFALDVSLAGGLIGEVSNSFHSADSPIGPVVNGIEISNTLLTRVTRSFNSGAVTARNQIKGTQLFSGGLIGRVHNNVSAETKYYAKASIQQSYNHGAINAIGYVSSVTENGGIGGLLGQQGNYGRVIFAQNYNIGVVSNNQTVAPNSQKAYAGSISGKGGAGFVIAGTSDNSNTFFLTGTQAIGDVPTAPTWAIEKTAAQLKTTSGYYVYGWGWNFNTIWQLVTPNETYPILR